MRNKVQRNYVAKGSITEGSTRTGIQIQPAMLKRDMEEWGGKVRQCYKHTVTFLVRFLYGMGNIPSKTEKFIFRKLQPFSLI